MWWFGFILLSGGLPARVAHIIRFNFLVIVIAEMENASRGQYR